MHNFHLKLYLILTYLLVCTQFSFSQTKYYSNSKKAIKKFETALNQYNLKSFEIAKKELQDALLIDNQFLEAYILLAEIANEGNNKSLAVTYYTNAINIKSDYNALMFLRRADLEKETCKYQEAKDDYQKYISLEKKKDYTEIINKKIKQCDFAIKQINNAVDFKPENIGPNINTIISEYWPSITADGNTIVYTSSDRQINSQEDLFYSEKQNGKWMLAKKFPEPINSPQSEGAQTISADGKTMIFTACLRKDSYGSCDLYISKKKGNNWSKPVNMGQSVNGNYKETQPCLSSDAKTLYFVSNRPGGKGKFDIWISNLDENNKWSQPLNAGDSINTSEDELAPFIHYDNNTLYFSSEGHLGMGGSDLFISRRDNNKDWSKAKNAGYPINTCYNEESLVITSDGEFGLISSNMDGGYGQKDIYQFKIPQSLKPGKTSFIKGIVFDAKTNKAISAIISISSLEDEKMVKSESDELNGEFLVCLASNKNYAFHINKPGYMIYSSNHLISDSSIYIKIPLQPIEIGELAVMKNIFFEFNSYELKKESFAELDIIVDFIKQNKLIVEIQGHTDNIGTEAFNLKLSENRAKTVYEYLIKKGIEKKKLTHKGYGLKFPIANNSTIEGQALNRRTSIKIIAKE